jgi:hypothetical protein
LRNDERLSQRSEECPVRPIRISAGAHGCQRVEAGVSVAVTSGAARGTTQRIDAALAA